RCPAAAGPPSARATCSTCVNNSARRSRPRITNSPPACATRFDRRKPRMNLDSLIPSIGEWLRGSGPEADIVVSTRIRLARNLAAFPFTNRASPHQKAEVEHLLRERILKLSQAPPLQYVHVGGLPALDRQFLVERQLISRE